MGNAAGLLRRVTHRKPCARGLHGTHPARAGVSPSPVRCVAGVTVAWKPHSHAACQPFAGGRGRTDVTTATRRGLLHYATLGHMARVVEPFGDVGTPLAPSPPYRREGGKASCDYAPNTAARIPAAAVWRRLWMAQGKVGANLAAGNGYLPHVRQQRFTDRWMVQAEFRRKAVTRAVTRQPLWPGHQWKPPARPLRAGGLPLSAHHRTTHGCLE